MIGSTPRQTEMPDDKARNPHFPQEGGCLCGAVRSPRWPAECRLCLPLQGLPAHIEQHAHHFDGGRARTGDGFVRHVSSCSRKRPIQDGIRACCAARHAAPAFSHEPAADSELLIMKAGNLDDMSWARPDRQYLDVKPGTMVEIDDLGPNYDRPAGQPGGAGCGLGRLARLNRGDPSGQASRNRRMRLHDGVRRALLHYYVYLLYVRIK